MIRTLGVMSGHVLIQVLIQIVSPPSILSLVQCVCVQAQVVGDPKAIYVVMAKSVVMLILHLVLLVLKVHKALVVVVVQPG
jgi:hypothetical protein